VDLIFLGGLGEIGLNAMVFETSRQPGPGGCRHHVSRGLYAGHRYGHPRFFLRLADRREKVLALILTHGHEDHIGAVPFLVREYNLPIYGTPLTLALLREKLREHHLLAQAASTPFTPGEAHPGAVHL
jgi:ribonuclease J